MARGAWLMAGLWSAGTAAATTLAWIGAHAVSSAIGATSVPVVPPAPRPAPGRIGLAAGTPATAPPTTVFPAAPAAPSTRTRTFSDSGGTITVRCTSAGIELVSASPSDGYRGEVGSAGPNSVSITFVARSWSYRIDARCSGGVPMARSTLNQSPSPPPPH